MDLLKVIIGLVFVFLFIIIFDNNNTSGSC